MKNRNYFIVIFFLLLSLSSISQQRVITITEQNNINLFNDFKNYLLSSVHKNENIADTTHLKYVLLHYLFINKRLDSSAQETIKDTELSEDQLKSLKKELNTFSGFMQDHEKDHLAENLTLMPVRMSIDTFIYNRLTTFQKENTFIFYNKRLPDKILGYILFAPSIENKLPEPRIWSWTLLFKFGKYMFKSFTGDEGYEYIFTPRKSNK